MICKNCITSLDKIIMFQQQCLRGKDIFSNYTENSIFKDGHQLKICICHLKYEEKQNLQKFVNFANDFHNYELFDVWNDVSDEKYKNEAFTG